MKIHFSWTISAGNLMELESKIMVASTKGIDCHNTIWVQEHEYNLVSPSLKKIAEVLPYKPHSYLLDPWSTTPKWNVEPKGDIIIGTDADVMIWNQNLVIQEAKRCLKNKQISGTIGYAAPISIFEWEFLFKKYGIEEDFKYQYTNTKEKSPFYINNGVVMMPSDMLFKFKESYQKWLLEINKWHYKSYYICQIATTFAIKELKLPTASMPRIFNYTEVDNPNVPELEKAIFLHYNITREEISKGGIDSIKNSTIKKRITNLIKKEAMML